VRCTERLGDLQALGTGGTLADAIGGISMLHGLAALDGDPGTSGIVLVSKPPSPEVAPRVLGAAEAGDKPVVVIFWVADPIRHPHADGPSAGLRSRGVSAPPTLPRPRYGRLALAKGSPDSAPSTITNDMRRHCVSPRSMAPSQRYVRHLLRWHILFRSPTRHGQRISPTHTPVKGNTHCRTSGKSQENHRRHGRDDSPRPAGIP